ncbi:MAG: hypothetical protein WDN76_04390 [Alphaproteobacteria bacterium]
MISAASISAPARGQGGHGALLDAQMLAEIYIELHGGREQALEFVEQQTSKNENEFETPVLEIVRRQQRPVQLSLFSTLERTRRAREIRGPTIGRFALAEKTPPSAGLAHRAIR